VYAFGPGAQFEGRLVGALERIEAGGSVRILEALFVHRDEAGELAAVDLKGGSAGGMTASLLSFRLDPAARARLTRKSLVGDSTGTVKELSDGLEPGTALVALLIEHKWARALDDAIEHTGGTPLIAEFVDATTLAELAPELLSAPETP
jgi:hypothetical protein